MRRINLMALGIALGFAVAFAGTANAAGPPALHPVISLLTTTPPPVCTQSEIVQAKYCKRGRYCAQWGWCWKHIFPGGKPFKCCKRWVCW